jgi:predicted ATP-binding protein involved in virulence
MKLVKARIQNFRSIEDTGIFEIDNLTCLVGKNEAGKTAVLQALEALRPYDDSTIGGYDVTRDYPRRFRTQFEQRHPSGKAEVCATWWDIDDEDREALAEEFGAEFLKSKQVKISRGYNYKNQEWEIEFDDKKGIEHLLSFYKLDAAERAQLAKNDEKDFFQALKNLTTRTEKQEKLFQQISKYRDGRMHLKAIDILSKQTPEFVYVSHYDRMSGQISVDHLLKKQAEKDISADDAIFLSFLNLAGTSLDDLKDSTKYEDLKAKCEAASNAITGQIFDYWSQNDALEVQIDFSQGKAEDPVPFNAGTVVRARVWNGNHKASVPFSERSAGFVWFFSFLVKFAEIRNEMGNVIVLLDEPGLTLHGKAQADLLRYIEKELLPHHQVLFSTHSPFLVPAHRLDDVRVVEDVLEYKKGSSRPIVHGTKVVADALSTDRDTLFPLQGALGYDICQSLFIGKHTLLVEGPSDILYLQALSSALKQRGRTALDSRWTVCPSGGIDKVQPFISLFSGNHLDIAVLTDQGKGDKGKIERMKKSDILRAGRFYSVAEFVGKDEGDIEDVFEPELYVMIVNSAFGLPKATAITAKKLDEADPNTLRLVKKMEAAFKVLPANSPEFDHFTPSDWLIKNPAILEVDNEVVNKTLDKAETIFKTFNALLDETIAKAVA